MKGDEARLGMRNPFGPRSEYIILVGYSERK
jgi:hypothetical protein